MGCLTLDEATAHLTAFRSCLMKEMEESIAFEGRRHGGKAPTPEKEDVLGCIVYTLVRYQLDGVGCLLAYLEFLLGKEIDSVLRGRRVDCFKTDLEAAYWFASQPVVSIHYSLHEESQ